MQIDPSKGKGHAAPKADRTGRTDLFDVLATRRPGVPADDGWLGHIAINPAVGKARPPGPEQRAGRQDLFPILQQKILDDPQRAQLLKRGADNLGDAWCGNLAIGVHSGKKPAAGTEMAFVNHIVGGGGALRTDLADDDVSPWDRPKPPPPADSHRVKYSRDIVGDILTAKATVPPREEGKRQYPRSIPAPDTVTDIYGLMTFKPLSPAAQAAVKLNSSRKAPFPGHPATQSTGNEMLLHRSSLLPRRGPYY